MAMENNTISNPIRITLLICVILLIFVLFTPIWKIELSAPQYPEGLMMNIGANGLGGDVAIINGLNHYIGMKTLHNEDFIEFKILPYLIVGFALFFFIVAVLKNRKLMYILLTLFILFGTVAMIDFWKWEYDYGHNLDPNAAIIVPGMAYQPPLIGYKQLLNFGAYSVPDIGGWLFIIVGALLLICVIADVRGRKNFKPNGVGIAVIGFMVLIIPGCTSGPDPIKVGKDNCHYCKMTISDNRFGAEVITLKGKVFKYDDLHCLQAEIHDKGLPMNTVKDIYFTDFCGNRALIKKQACLFLQSNNIKAPMGGNIAAFSSPDSLQYYRNQLTGEEIMQNKIISLNE
jgi:copper chaperone NosL